MRAFFAAVEQGLPVVRTADLDPAPTPTELAALRDAGLLRDEGRAGIEEISASDLARALRALYAVQGRGLPVPATFGRDPMMLGWSGEGDSERDVFLLTGPGLSLTSALFRSRRTLLLLPTARLLTPELRAKHAPGSFIVIDVLEESLTVHAGRLARATVRAPSAPDLSAFSPDPAPTPAIPPALSSAPPPAPRIIPGATRWNEIHISLVDPTTVRVDLPGVSVRRTYVDLGMAHSKNRQPRRVWELLVELCDGHGIFLSTRFGSADATKKLISRLGGELGAIFGLGDSAFHPYRPTEGWQTRFQASPRIR
jgi:hypothetical protein